MAKGLEDTAAYVYNPLLSLNEVGGCRQAVSPTAFHAFCRERQERWPGTLNASSTHDTKRSEDVRARLNVLTEMPAVWRQKLATWRSWNAPGKTILDGQEVPDTNEEIFLYQTLLGAWPLDSQEVPEFQARLQRYLVKALREAKVHSRWIEPREDYEQAVLAFVAAILADHPENDFLPDFLAFQKTVAWFGALNSLSQMVLKITAPGIPDIYQGTELWDFSLVDPDNRRPVDFARRQKLLAELRRREAAGDPDLAGELLASWRDGRIKMFLLSKGLQLRQMQRDLFAQGAYLPLSVTGAQADRVVAFARGWQDRWAVVAVGRLFAGLTEPEIPPVGPSVWQDTTVALPAGAPRRWRELFSGRCLSATANLPVAQALATLPVALLVPETAGT